MALRLEQRPVLLLGGDEEAVSKLPRLLAAGARVTCVSSAHAGPVADHARRGELIWFRRAWVDSDLEGQVAVFLTSRDRAEAARLRTLKARYGFLFCAVDLPEFCDFFLMSTVQRGPVQVAISTGGAAPLLARRLRLSLEQGLDARFEAFCDEVARLRSQLASADREERVARLEAALNGFAMEVTLRYPEVVRPP